MAKPPAKKPPKILRSKRARSCGLPLREFMYTLDQVSMLLAIPEKRLHKEYLYYQDVTPGRRPQRMITARNISPALATPDWRVAESELVRWLRFHRVKVYDRAFVE